MKVLHVLNTSKFSGAENVVCQIIQMFQDEEIDMVYCSFDGDIRDALAEKGITFAPVRSMTVKEIKRVIAEQKPDVIHAHDMKAGFVVSNACGKIPLVAHIHNSDFQSRKISPKSVAFLKAGLQAKKIIWVSKSAYESYYFHNLMKKKSHIIYNVIKIDELIEKKKADPNRYDFDVVYCGRITEVKDPYRLLEICTLLTKEKKDIRIAVIGNGEMEAEIKQYADRMQLGNNVFFLGYQANPIKMISDAKCLIMTSRREGTPMVVLEALALGVPVVSTPVDGLLDLIQNDTNGYLSADNDILAKYILNIVRDPALHEKLSVNARKQAIQYNDIKKVKMKLKEIYEYKEPVK